MDDYVILNLELSVFDFFFKSRTYTLEMRDQEQDSLKFGVIDVSVLFLSL